MDTAIHKGKPFWSGVFDANDGFIREVHPYKRAKAADFHHSYYVSSQSQDAMKQGDAGFFWVDPDGSVNTDWREGSAPKHIVDAIQDQIEPIPHKDNGGGITAYQGGPHSVGEEGFLDEKIGTGEGFQSYGHGHYFAEAEPVAQGYRDALAQKRNPTTSINDLIGQMSKNSPESRTPKNIQWYMKQDPMLSPHAGDKEIVGHISEALNGQNADGSVSESALDAYGKLTDKFGRNPKGHMHEVSINAHPDHMLDWDKTIDEQSDYVKNALNKTEWWPWTKERIEDRAGRHGSNPQGRHLYEDLVEDYSPEEASKFLQDTDIHGIKYLDASSRSKGEGTRNYVVFDPKRVDIKRRYKDGGEVDDDGITAYHGSPHDFDQFDMAKIGKGVGEQAYGHGLYFTEHEPTAIDFRDRATASKNINDFNLYRISGSNEEFEPQKQGHMYEVNINAHPDHMLDWNKPLSEQSPYIVKNIFDARKDNPTLFNVFKSHFEKDSTGMDFYQALATQHPNGYQGASEFLQRSGVHGVKYRDENSRDKGKGTTNYVVFDPKNVDVKRKYEQGGEVLAHDSMERDDNLGKFLQGSRVRNGEGDHVVLYHITPKDFDTFKAGGDDPELSGPGIWLSPNKHHLPAAHNVGGGSKGYDTGTNVMPVYANIKSPLVLDTRDMIDWAKTSYGAGSEFPLYLRPKVKQKLIEDGYDGIFYAGGRGVEYGTNGIGIGEQPNSQEEVIAFHPHQIKSAIGNNGNFDPSRPKITEARGGRIGYDYGGDVRTGDNPGGLADANRPAVTSRDADRNYNAGSGIQTAGPSSDNRPDNRPDNSNDRFNIGGGGAPMPPERGDDSFFGNMGGNIGSVLGGLAFGPLGSIGGRYLGNQFNQPDNSRFEAKNDEFGNPVGGGWLDFLGSGNPPAPMTSDNRRDPIKRKRRILMPDGTYQEVEEGMKSGGVAKSYNRVHNSKIVEHALSKVGVSLHTRRPPS